MAKKNGNGKKEKAEPVETETLPAQSEERALALIENNEYAIISRPSHEIKELMEETFEGESVDRFDLDQIKIPAAGGLTWTVQTLDGPKPQETVEGVIVFKKVTRAYWKTPYDQSGGGSPPDCQSDGGLVGVGDPGGRCGKPGRPGCCPMNEWGTTHIPGSQARACKTVLLIFLVRPGNMLPVCLPLPPTSFKETDAYLKRLASQGRNRYSVVTRFALEKAKSATGHEFSKAIPTRVRDLEGPELERVKAYVNSILGNLEAITVDQVVSQADLEGEAE